MLLTRVTVFLVLVAATLTASASCWEQAARRYDVPVQLLRAIARHESGMNPRALGANRNGTHDIGLMQINEAWLPTLAQFGITQQTLLDPCVNVNVGAWILALNIQRHGYGWEAVGAYNVGCRELDAAECTRRRNLYTARIARQLRDPQTVVRPVPVAGIATVALDEIEVAGAEAAQ